MWRKSLSPLLTIREFVGITAAKKIHFAVLRRREPVVVSRGGQVALHHADLPTVLARISKECPFVGLALRLFLVSYDYPLLISYSFMSQLISRRVWHIVISTESHHIFSQPR